METFFTNVQIIIYSLPPLLLSVIIIEAVWKNRFRTKEVLNWIRWSIIVCSIISLVSFVFYIDTAAFINRATGSYSVAYWLMLIGASGLPFTLFHKKFATKAFYLLFITFMMNIGRYFELFVIMTTSFHRDYAPTGTSSDWDVTLVYAIISLLLNGFILAFILLGIAELKHRILTARKSS